MDGDGGAISPTAKVQRSKSLMLKRKNSPMAQKRKSLSSKSFRQKDIKDVKVSNTAKPWLSTSTNVSKNAPTPNIKEKKEVPLPDSACNSLKKGLWKKRPKPAHSGVPLPEKMKNFIAQGWKDADFDLV